MNDAATTPSEGSTHGFLFADLRGYAQLVDTRGALEASHILERYRAIVREVVARDGGAEIKTEGDSFYVVLPSASAALRCGLDILAACAKPADGGEAIAAGIGIHAGESIAHEGGFVSSAVNIAARICALAAPGELLASGTIRELTRSIVAAQFVFVGRRQLKGLAEPVELFRVVPESAALPLTGGRRDTSAGRPIRRLAIAAVAIAVVATGAAIVLAQRPATGPAAPGGSGSPTASEGASASQVAASPSGGIARLPIGLIPLGTYAPTVNRDVASVTIAEPGWRVVVDWADLLYFSQSSASGIGVGRITVVYTGPCPDDPTRLLGDRPQDLIAWVQSAPQFEASLPTAVIELGRSGIGIDATVRPNPVGTCAAGSARLWGVGGTVWSPNTGDAILFEALDDGPRTLTVVFAANTAGELVASEGPGRRLLGGIVINP
jgi:class 3 adenylate cyclase